MIHKMKHVLIGLALTIQAAMTAQFLEGATLHSIIVVDTTAWWIGEFSKPDFVNMREEFRKVADHTGLDLNEVMIRGKEVEPKKVLAQLTRLNVEPDDVVIFFFSGLGYRTPEKTEENPWPNLYFSRTGVGIDYAHIGQILERFNPRLFLMMACSSNDVISGFFTPPVVRNTHFKKGDFFMVKENYRKLFLDTSGVVKFTSSVPGEYSWLTANGALSTQAFLIALHKEVESTKEPSWENVFECVALQTHLLQHPHYEIYLDEAADVRD